MEAELMRLPDDQEWIVVRTKSTLCGGTHDDLSDAATSASAPP
jgi:hypothetical protein